MQEIVEKENIMFAQEWLQTTDYELKILLLTSMLAENNLAYRGTLATMCEWLGIKTSSSNNNNNIKKALETLQEKEYIFYKVDGRTYTISISNKGLKNKKIVYIRKEWLKTLKNYKKEENNYISIGWHNLIKVFIYIYSNDFKESVRLKDIAEQLNISTKTLSNALNVIVETKLDKLKVTKSTDRAKVEIECANGKKVTLPRNIGTNINVFIMFE